MANELNRDKFRELMELDKIAKVGIDIIVDKYMTPVLVDSIKLDQELVDMYPPSDALNYESFKESIRQNGQRVPVLAKARSGEVIDGRHRVKALSELGIPYVLVEYLPHNYTKEQMIAELKIRNGDRRDLSATQRAIIALRHREANGGVQADVALEYGVSRTTLSDAELVWKNIGMIDKKALFEGGSIAVVESERKTTISKSVQTLAKAFKRKNKPINDKNDYIPTSQEFFNVKDAVFSLPFEDKSNLLLSLKRNIETTLAQV